jgi:hypothetical protein
MLKAKASKKTRWMGEAGICSCKIWTMFRGETPTIHAQLQGLQSIICVAVPQWDKHYHAGNHFMFSPLVKDDSNNLVSKAVFPIKSLHVK